MYPCQPARRAVSFRGFRGTNMLFVCRSRGRYQRDFCVEPFSTKTMNKGKKIPADILSCWGFHAAPRICFGSTLALLTVAVFTCARYPQKSQMRSAHLKLTGRVLRVFPFDLHPGQSIVFAINFSPKSPSTCLSVGILSPYLSKLLRSQEAKCQATRCPRHLLS